ncbi:MAG TPA: ATP-binding protein [Bacteroidales bacterium]
MGVKSVHKRKKREKTDILPGDDYIYDAPLELLLDNVDEIIAFIDINLRYLHVNKAYADKFNLKKDNIVLKYISEVLPEDSFSLALPWFIKAFQGESVKFNDTTQSPPSEILLIPHRDESLDVKGCILIVNKHSKNKNSQNADLTLDQLFDLNLDLICITSIDGIFLRLSPQWETLLGFELKELEGHDLLGFVHPDEILMTKNAILSLQNQTDRIEFSSRFVCKDGNYRWLEWHARINKNLIYAIVRDITTHVISEENIKASGHKLFELNAAKDKFFSIISHDLKSPFNNILGFSELLYSNLDSYNKDLIRQISEQLYNSAKTAFDLLENLLEWSNLQTQRIEYEPRQTNLSELFNLCLPFLQVMVTAKHITFEFDIPAGLTVFTDSNLTKTIIRNLLSNAIKFSHSHGKITVTVKEYDSFAHISIIDNGVGIPAQNLNKLFRIDNKYSTLGTMNERGTGLGLILCKELVEKQGGTLSVTSQEGKGSNFTFTLPL